MAAQPTKEVDTSKTPSTEEGKEVPQGAPEKYEFKAPEGMQLDEKALEAATPIFKELGLNNDQAQKLVDLYTVQTKAAADAPAQAFRELNDQWRGEVIKDPTIGNGKDGLAAPVSAAIGNAINSLGAEQAAAFRDMLDKTGLGNNPTFIKGLYGMVKDAGEGRHVSGAGPSPEGQRSPGSPKTAAQKMYPTLPSAASAS